MRPSFHSTLPVNCGHATPMRDVSPRLPKALRQRLPAMQNAWLRFRTEACRDEARIRSGGGIHDDACWTCATRMTHQRTAELLKRADRCEGEIDCARRRP